MKNLNLSPFKRLLMVVLVAISNVCLGTKLSYGLSVIGLPTADYAISCVSWCGSIVGTPYAVSGTSMLTWPNVTNAPGVSFVPAACYCANANEMSMLAFARNGAVQLAVACSSVTYFSPITCVFSVLGGGGGGGGGSTTVNCGYGQYKNGNTCYNCPAGKYANVINTATCVSCANGYYAAGTGNSTCTPCAKGTYGNGTAASKCNACPTLMAVLQLVSAGVTSIQGFGGTTAGTGTTAITGCYMAAISVGQMLTSGIVFNGFYESPGHYYDFTGNCTYSK